MKKIIYLPILMLVLTLTQPVAVNAQQVADMGYTYKIKKPAYELGKGPIIGFDEAHNNEQTLKGTYFPFNKLLSQDGYNLKPVRERLTPGALKDVGIFVTVNAMYDPGNWNLPIRSVFKNDEIEVIFDWVNNGGSLFLITDHMPCSGSAHDLAAKFGFNLINGTAIRKDRKPEKFSKEKHTLHASVITNTPGAEIDSIMIWGGAAFIAPKNAEIISSLSDDYEVFLPSKTSDISFPIADTIPKISGSGLANGAFLKAGKGRVVVFVDGAAFTAQLEGIKSKKRGINNPGASQNAQFLLNIIRWLDKKL